jgi:hypothetical protein
VGDMKNKKNEQNHQWICKESEMTRLEANRKILKILSEYLEKYPTMRFNQALLNLDIVIKNSDQFYEESEKTLKRAEIRKNEFNGH